MIRQSTQSTAARYYLDAAQAAAALGVTRATLYAYTSRGQLRSEPVPGRPRAHRYVREDVERLRRRKQARRDPAAAAAQGLQWGGPVLESGITLIHNGRLYYRGRDALVFAATATAEDAAAWLWAGANATGEADAGRRLFDQRPVLAARQVAQLRRSISDPFARLQAALPLAATLDLRSYDLRPAAVRQAAARIMRLFTTIVGGHESRRPLHRVLQAAWAPRRAAAADAIRLALVLCADHELNVSAFTARCAASAGAPPYDVVAAAMATLKGYKHGGAAARVLALVDGAGTLKSARAAIAGRLRAGESIAGFGHPLYPSGDPRGAMLIRQAERAGADAALRPFRHLFRAGSELLQDAPNVDSGLAAVSRAYGFPDEAPLLLFAIGRTIGWIAHAIEEYASDRLIRPRARYTGPAPGGDVG